MLAGDVGPSSSALSTRALREDGRTTQGSSHWSTDPPGPCRVARVPGAAGSTALPVAHLTSPGQHAAAGVLAHP